MGFFQWHSRKLGKKARWVKDGKYYTSSCITAGIDMTFGFVSDMHGIGVSRKVTGAIEYIWNEDANNDPFTVE